MSRPNIKHGVVVGTGAAINVQLGWVPDSVDIYNASDGDLITTAYLIPYIISFTGGGTAELLAGAAIRGATSSATARVAQVNLVSGTWAAGTAAGFFTLEEDSYTGTFTSTGENIVITNLASGVLGTDDATIPSTVVTAPPAGVIADSNVAVALAATIANGVTGLSRYVGASGSAAKGFTIGATVSESGKLLRYRAFRGDVV